MWTYIAGIVRHVLTLLGGAGFVVADDVVMQVVSALAAIAGVVWSIVYKRLAGKK